MIKSAVPTSTIQATDTRRLAKQGHKVIIAACGALTLALSLAHLLVAQVSRPAIVQAPYPGQLGHPGPESDTPTADPAMTRKLIRAMNLERQKSMISDTNKLLKLARELSAETAGEDSKKPSGQQMHKAAEIEKLAHNVREKMTYVVGGAPGEPALLRPIN